MDGGDVGTIDAPVDLGTLESPCLESKGHVVVPVIIVIEKVSLGCGVQDAHPYHRSLPSLL
jgi:hypothetical protein